MSEQDKDRELLNAIKHELDNSIERVDAQTRSRLTQIRHQALQRKKKSNLIDSPFVPVSVFATACLVVAVALYIPDNSDMQNPDDIVSDLDLISSTENLEFFEELEFYEWLEDYDLPT